MVSKGIKLIASSLLLAFYADGASAQTEGACSGKEGRGAARLVSMIEKRCSALEKLSKRMGGKSGKTAASTASSSTIEFDVCAAALEAATAKLQEFGCDDVEGKGGAKGGKKGKGKSDGQDVNGEETDQDDEGSIGKGKSKGKGGSSSAGKGKKGQGGQGKGGGTTKFDPTAAGEDASFDDLDGEERGSKGGKGPKGKGKSTTDEEERAENWGG